MPSEPVETAWRIHATLVDWTAKVDSKASFALAIESAALAGVATLTDDGRRLHALVGWELFWFWLGLICLFAAVVSAVFVVRPRLRGGDVGHEANKNFVYFGHLRYWEPDTLASALTHIDPLPALARQLVVMSKIAWQKHIAVQWSMQLAVAGIACIFIAYVMAG